MAFEASPRATELLAALREFMDAFVYPAEPVYAEWRREAGAFDHTLPPVVETLKTVARERGLWNLFLPAESGLSVTDYATLAEETGRSPVIAPEALNCAAPDTGNMELLHLFGTQEQQDQWLRPLLEGEIRSAFAMTEPAVASSDATNIQTSIVRSGDEYVVNGRKWWTTGAADPRCAVLIVMGRTNPEAPKHQQQSMVLIPIPSNGLRVLRSLPVFGYHDQHGHCEIEFENVRVPRSSLLGNEGTGFAMAQARLGPGRLHHCMRAIGMAERALDLACQRVVDRVAFGGPLANQGTVQAQIAECRLSIDQARLLTLHAAWTIDQCGSGSARQQVAAAKIAAPRAALLTLDTAIQLHGAAGVSQDFPLAEMWAQARTLRIADGPDEVHLRSIAREELALGRPS